MSSFNHGFKNGALIQNVPYHNAVPGKVFYVGNSGSTLQRGVSQKSASDGNDGSFNAPFATIDYAIGKCLANRGDIIFVRPGHSETITAASAIDLDVAGISLIGLGHGSDMPEIEFNHANATVAIGADNILIDNINFNSSISGVTVGVNVEDGVNHFRIAHCRFDVDADGTDEFLHAIRFVNNNNYCVVEENVIDMGIGGATAAIHLDADTDHLIIRKNIIRGDFSTANIAGDTTLSTDLLIEDNLLINGEYGDLNAQPAIELLTGTHGVIRDNDIVCNEATPAAAIVADSCLLFDNKYSETAAVAALDLPPKLSDVANVVVKTNATLSADDLFDINTGSVLIHELFAICTTAESGGTNPVVSLQNDVDAGSDYAIATGLDLASLSVSDSLNFASMGSVLVKTVGGALTSGAKPFVAPAGVIESVLDSGSYSAGDVTWICVWSPITSGATVTAAA